MTLRKKEARSSLSERREINPFADLELRSLSDYVKIIKERLLIAVGCSLLVAFLFGYHQLQKPKIYEAHSTLLLERQSERVVDMQRVVDTGLEGAFWNYTALIQTQIQQIQSRSFRQYVLQSFSEKEIEAIVDPYRSDEEGAPPPSAAGILGAVSAENPRDTYLVRIRFRHRDPQVAAMVADRFAEQYIRFAMDRFHSGNDLALGFLNEQAADLRKRVEEAEQQLQNYRQMHNLVSVEENQNIIVQRLKDVNSALTVSRIRRLALADQMKQVREHLENERDLLEISEILRFSSTSQLVTELDKLRTRREVMGEKYARLHPRMIENERAIASTQRALSESISLAVADLQSRHEGARQNEESLRAELREAEQESFKLDQLTIHYQVLRRNADSARATFSQIIHRLNETAITSQLESNPIRIADRASVPGAPIEPNVRKVAMMVLFLSCFIFVGVPVGLEFIDNKVKTAWDVEHFIGAELAAEIPIAAKLSEESRAHVVERDEPPAEAFRGLISQLELTTEVDFPKTMVVTSTLPREGKTFIASNLAFCFAAHGKKTVLVDCDFRRPALQGLYGLDKKAGILACLQEDEEISPDSPLLGIQEVAPNLFVVPAGGHTRKATEQIKKPALEKLFNALRNRFDVVIIDTPPVGVFPDALLLSSFADEALYVARFGKVNRQQAKSFVDRLKATGVSIAGVVINAMPKGKHSSYGYYGYYKYQDYYNKDSSP